MVEGAKKNQGFTLIELIVSVTLFAIVSGALMATFSNSAQINGRAKTMLKATNVAQYVVESLKQYTYEDVSEAMADGTKRAQLITSIVPGSGYVMTPTTLSGATSAETLVSEAKLSASKVLYTNFGTGGGFITLKGLTYEGVIYDIVITFKDERVAATTASHFVYTTKVDVYKATQTESFTGTGPLVSLKGSIYNQE